MSTLLFILGVIFCIGLYFCFGIFLARFLQVSKKEYNSTIMIVILLWPAALYLWSISEMLYCGDKYLERLMDFIRRFLDD